MATELFRIDPLSVTRFPVRCRDPVSAVPFPPLAFVRRRKATGYGPRRFVRDAGSWSHARRAGLMVPRSCLPTAPPRARKRIELGRCFSRGVAVPRPRRTDRSRGILSMAGLISRNHVIAFGPVCRFYRAEPPVDICVAHKMHDIKGKSPHGASVQ